MLKKLVAGLALCAAGAICDPQVGGADSGRSLEMVTLTDGATFPCDTGGHAFRVAVTGDGVRSVIVLDSTGFTMDAAILRTGDLGTPNPVFLGELHAFNPHPGTFFRAQQVTDFGPNSVKARGDGWALWAECGGGGVMNVYSTLHYAK